MDRLFSAGAGRSWSRRSSRCRSCCRPPSSGSTCWSPSARTVRSAAAYARPGGARAAVHVRGAAHRVGALLPAVRGPAVQRRVRRASIAGCSRRRGRLGVSRLATFRRVVIPLSLPRPRHRDRPELRAHARRVRRRADGRRQSTRRHADGVDLDLRFGPVARLSRRRRGHPCCCWSISFVILVVHVFAAADGMDQAAALAAGPEGPVLQVDVEQRFASGFNVCASLEVMLRPGSMLVLFGPSGAGKTTILRQIAGLERPDARHDPVRTRGLVRHRGAAVASPAGAPGRRRVSGTDPVSASHRPRQHRLRGQTRARPRPGQTSGSDPRVQKLPGCWGLRISQIAIRARCRAGKPSGWRSRVR